MTTALRIAVVQGALPDDWRALHERIDNGVTGTNEFRLYCTAVSAALLVATAAAWSLTRALSTLSPDRSIFIAACTALLPALLAGAAAGQTAGNLFLRLNLRLPAAARRGFATRLSLARCPEHWPQYLRNWLFTGDWLESPAYDLRLPYARIYVEDEAPLACRDEDALWREIHQAVSGDSLWEAGANFREISYTDRLPSWSALVEQGDGFEDLQARIGREEASQWLSHLWRRACRQWPSLGANDHPEQARRECFEMHSLPLTGARRALVVVLRPASFVDRFEQEQERRNAA